MSRKKEKLVFDFLVRNQGKKFSIGEIWREITKEANKDANASYSTIQLATQTLRFQKKIECEWVKNNKMLWVDLQIKPKKEIVGEIKQDDFKTKGELFKFLQSRKSSCLDKLIVIRVRENVLFDLFKEIKQLKRRVKE